MCDNLSFSGSPAVADRPLDIRIEGNGVVPRTIRLRDLYEVLHAFELAISYTATRKTDLHLTEIKEGNSADCTLLIDATAYPSAVRCATAIATRNLSGLPEKARDSLLLLKTKAAARGWVFRMGGGNGMPEAAIDSDTEFLVDSVVSGKSSIFGKLMRVGGTNPPTASIHLADANQRLSVDIASEALAAQLGRMLYRNVSLNGEAKWSAPSWTLIDFRVTEIGDYDDTSDITAVLQDLKAIAGSFWDDIDPDEYIAKLRDDAA